MQRVEGGHLAPGRRGQHQRAYGQRGRLLESVITGGVVLADVFDDLDGFHFELLVQVFVFEWLLKLHDGALGGDP